MDPPVNMALVAGHQGQKKVGARLGEVERFQGKGWLTMLEAAEGASARAVVSNGHLARVFYDNGAYSVQGVLKGAQGFDEAKIVADSKKACGWRMEGCAVLKVTIDVDPSETVRELAPMIEEAAQRKARESAARWSEMRELEGGLAASGVANQAGEMHAMAG